MNSRTTFFSIDLAIEAVEITIYNECDLPELHEQLRLADGSPIGPALFTQPQGNR
jgi:hypothetical protein